MAESSQSLPAAPASNQPQAWDDALLANPHAAPDKRQRVQKMFAAIAPSYDLNNRLHSLWQDQRWRKKAVNIAQLKPMDAVVDVACGTGDLAFEFAAHLWELAWERHRSGTLATPVVQCVVGIDFTFQMLAVAWRKTPLHGFFPEERRGRDDIRGLNYWINGDAQSLPLPDKSADVVSIAFGIRNVQDPAQAMREFHRILRPGGRVIVLEFSLPTNRILRGLYNFYFRQILPRTATLISGDKTGAYKYLPESVNTFISRAQMTQIMRDAGFDRVEQFPMTFGVCVCYRGIKA